MQTVTAAGYHADGGGLYLQVTPSGAKSWVFRYKRGGRARDMGLGSASVVGLQAARAAALEQRKILVAGGDPLAEKARQRIATAPMTFGQAAEAYIEAHRSGWKNDAQAHQWRQSLEAYGPPASLAIAAVDTNTVLAALRPIWTTKTETATRVRGRIERVLDWARVRGLREGENPARWRGHLDHLLPKPSKVTKAGHHAAMPYADVPTLYQRLGERDALARRALAFTILTAARTGEVTGARWEEFDLDAGVWTVPAERMKSGREHRVPLSEPALALLRRLPRGQPPFPLSENGMLALLQRQLGQPYTVHGFRSSFRDWVSEETDFPREVAEMALAHVIDDETEAAYRRGDLLAKRRELMRAWAGHLTGE